MYKLSPRERVPGYHYDSKESRALIEVLEAASLKAKAALEDVVAQFFISTATWGLTRWEEQVGITTDDTLPAETRRAAVLQKLLAQGNTTAGMIRELAESLTGYGAKVEVNDDYSFSLSFRDEENQLVSIDIEAIRGVVEQIKPAHLRFVITAVTWGDLELADMAWSHFEENAIVWGNLGVMLGE